MKFYESKVAKFIAGKGFYGVLAVCMLIIGVAAYSAMDKNENTPLGEESKNSSIIENEDDYIIPAVPNEDEDTDSENNGSSSQNLEATDVTDETNPPIFTLPVSNGKILKHYSAEALVYSNTYKDMRIHTGVDIEAGQDNAVLSAFSGTVIGVDEDTVYGTVVTVDHGDGITLHYCGLKNVTVKNGDVVDGQEVLGEIGTVTNESADRPHLHLELMINGEYSDPMTIFNQE